MDKKIDGENYIELGNILKRSRSEEETARVKEILEMNIPVDKKKAMIEQIDRESREQKIKARFQNLLKSSLDPLLNINANSMQIEIAERLKGIVKNNMFINILLIDDLTYITKTISYMLQKENYSVYTAKSGAEGLILFQNIVPDLVITDIRLPDFNGIELAELIRRLDETVPILFITAIDMDSEMKSYGLIKSRAAYLQKPIRKELLLETIKNLLKETD